MSCEDSNGKFRYFYTGNQVGYCNWVGDLNFVAGGLPGSNLSAGIISPTFFPDKPTRFLWRQPDASLTQELLNAQFYFIELNWVADIFLTPETTLRISDKNVYAQDDNAIPRFYEARASKAPHISVTAGEWLSPNFEIGDLKITLNNRDGFYNRYLPQGGDYTQWQGSEIRVRIGFGEKRSNYSEVFKGFISIKKGLETSHNTISIRAYDQFDQDEVPIPPRSYDETNFPNVDSSGKGRAVPLIYGDWSVEVGDYGEIPATCVNALDTFSTFFILQIADNSLREIGDVYLHRGSRKEGDEGPIKLLDAALTKEPQNGRLIVDANLSALSEAFAIAKDKKAGTGSGFNLILSETSEVNFLTLDVRIGDVVYKEGTNTPSLVTNVFSGQLDLSGGISYASGDAFSILTDRFRFRSGDKFSLFCKGKDIRTMSTFRLSDGGLPGSEPLGISITQRDTFWTIDNNVSKIYEVSLQNSEIVREIDFTDISPNITRLTGISEQVDQTLWLFDGNNSTIYRYVLADDSLGDEMATSSIAGLLISLTDGFGLTIDAGNILTIVDNNDGEFYRINPFDVGGPLLIAQFNRSAFEANALEITDISADSNLNELVIVDRETLKLYRIDPTTGALIAGKDFSLTSEISDSFTYPVGVSAFQDGTIYLLNRADLTVYNYNEFEDANENPGFIARDVLQKYAGRNTGDFSLRWNEACRLSLSKYFCRLYTDTKTNAVSYITKILQQFNTQISNRFLQYSLFAIDFDNFTTDGDPIKEKDIKMGSFNPSKEYNQYFNSGTSEYNEKPFSNSSLQSDIYISPLAISLAGREVSRKIDMQSIYRRADLDKLLPLFVRLAAAEPEFVELTLGFRFLFSQISDFYNINFYDVICTEAEQNTGRRFNNIPSFVRKLSFDLNNLEIKMKLWSLGTTAFGDFTPEGVVAGGQFDDIVLTNLGTPGYISPDGTITASTANSITVDDVEAIDAENRTHVSTGLAWTPGYKIVLVDAASHEVIEILTIDSVSGQVITTVENIATTIINTGKNAANFFSTGHYLRYANYDEVIADQKSRYGYYGRPEEAYPGTTTEEIEEQRAGKHNFFDDRLPYVLHPVNFVFS